MRLRHPDQRHAGQRRRVLRGICALCAVSVAVVAVPACGGSGRNSSAAWPDVPIADATGDEERSAAVLTAGRPAVVAIWGVNCAPCRQELPRLEALSAANTAVDVAAVNSGDSPGAIEAYLSELGLELEVFIDDEARLGEALGVSSLPATVFVRADGRIDDVHFGELSAEQLDAGVDRLTGG